MDWHAYGSFVVIALVLVVVPGPDFAVITRNALTLGRRGGWWAAVGVVTSNAVQGLAAAVGLGALIVASQPVFKAITWLGIAYLVYLGVQAFRSAWRGDYAPDPAAPATPARRVALSGWRQGFLSNITNPKVLVFYLAVLPPFLPESASVAQILPLAFTHALLSLGYLTVLVFGLHTIREFLARRLVRRALDTGTGVALLGFGARLAAEDA
ncbi:LysE family translocator [Phytomonospora endophytica]|uniref:Threonine/homoserine/homoserine lactone efflux protein n=1 Tax=Phytomonospora endophytica TaxID=714109 RepID=A0A841FWE8_9ACTN|nr:LysE family translocator [Phytomonospora endophytica]MBB6036809.1 threonine/homoserine/homoserine lactone efflux protein [Phytomonospora endophytica]